MQIRLGRIAIDDAPIRYRDAVLSELEGDK